MTDSGIPFNKASAKIRKLKEALEVSTKGGFSVFDHIDLGCIYFNSISRDNNAKEGTSYSVEFAFFRFNI